MRRVLRVTVLLAALGAAPLATAQSISTMVPAPDGTLLATDVYLPPGTEPWPVVLIRTPYGKSGEKSTCRAFEAFGYGCVAQDTRGRSQSQGQDTAFRDDGPDGRATVAWIAAQPWCNGSIGTFGASALGITQYMMAPGAPPALRCQIPIVATPDLYADAMFQGGALRRSLVINWLSGQGSLDVLDQVLDHRLASSWWDPVDSLKRAQDVTVPALHMGGWFDIFEQGTLDAFARFQHDGGDGARGRQYLVMGPWTHTGFGQSAEGQLVFPGNAIVNLVDLWTDFLGHWLKGKANGVDRWPAVRVYLMGAVGERGADGNRWIDLNDWPPPAVRRRLYLAAPGNLKWSVPPFAETEMIADPQNPVPTLGGANLFPDLEVDGRPMGAGPYDERSVEARDDVVVFSTPPLKRPLTVIGRITGRIWLVPQTPDLDVAIRLTDVYPDGRSMLLCDGISRARYHLGRDREAFLTPGRPVALTVDLWSTAMVFAAGHRIRISISGSNSPRFAVNPNDGTNPEDGSAGIVADTMILLGGHRPSFVELPVVVPPRRSAGRVRPAGRAGACMFRDP